MAIIIEAVYENGVLKPMGPLPFKEHEKVEVLVRTKTSAEASVVVPCEDEALIEWAAMSPELEYPCAEEAE